MSPPAAFYEQFAAGLFMSAGCMTAGWLQFSTNPPKVLYVGVTTHVWLAVERSRRSRASATRIVAKCQPATVDALALGVRVPVASVTEHRRYVV